MTRVQLGSGGMAVVTLEVTSTHGLVAVKRMHAHLVEHGHCRASFEREAAIHATVSAPNVCAFVGADFSEQPQILLEYVRGLSLEQISRGLERMQDPRFFATIVRDTFDAVVAVHTSYDGETSAQIIHGDLAPDNVLLSFEGVIKLIDFGVATSGEAREPVGGEHGRTPYLSPERLAGERFDQRADQWSLAVLLYELLSGTHPFRRASEPATFRAIVEEEVPALSSVAPKERQAWLARLDAPISRALRRDPLARYADVAAFATDVLGRLGVEGDRALVRAWLNTNFALQKQRLERAEKSISG